MKQIGQIARRIADVTLRASIVTTSSTSDLPRPEKVCPHCNGLGYVRYDLPLDHPDFGKLHPCVCRLQEHSQQRVDQLRALSNLDILERMTFATFVPEGHGLQPERQDNLRLAYETARSYAENPSGWLLLRGGYGCGKTHLAVAIANRAVERGQPALFITVPDLLDHLRAAFGPTSPAGYDQRFEQVRTVSLLILDDLGTEAPTPWAQEKLFQILNYRYNARLPTVITTNHELEEIPLRIRSRLVDPDLTRVVTILARDYRATGEVDSSILGSLRLHSHQTFENFDLRRGELPQEELDNLRLALEIARDFAASPEGWLVLTGPHGCGKTHLAAAVANTHAKHGDAVLFVVAPDLLDHLRATFSPQSATSFDKRFDQVRRVPLLVLDDLGTESATPWAREKLYQVFDYRYNARLATVITTATPIEELDPRLATRMLDLSCCTLVGIIAPAYRGGLRRQKRR
ncbi:MAG: ATP-binding protein [Anaerolineae bacterium]|nr:ATP-binding protein [Anaerolineae bacterium]